jgi:hypothetical protein
MCVVKLSTDDSRFGVVITPSASHDQRFFTFQLVIAGETIGDREPSIVWTAVNGLHAVPVVVDQRLDPVRNAPASIVELCLADEHLHDEVVHSQSESLDGWLTIAYILDNRVVWIAREYADPGHVLSTTLCLSEFNEVARAVLTYHQAQADR